MIVAFDLDGTLVDSTADLASALNFALSAHGMPTHDVEVVRGFIGDGARVLVQRAMPEGRRGLTHDVDVVLATFRGRYRDHLDVHTRAYPGVLVLLQDLRRRFRVGVATNKPGGFARTLVDRLLPGAVDVVFGPDDVGAHKPDPKMLLALDDRLNDRVAVFVGDSDVDEETARRKGCAFVRVSWHEDLRGAATSAQELARHIAAIVGG